MVRATSDNRINRDLSRFPDEWLKYSPANARMVKNVLLVWLDNNIDEVDNVDCRNTLAQLCWVVSNTQVFTDENKCLDFIYKTKHEKICMIISGSLGQNIVPVVHSMPSIDSIFIYCGNKSLHETWVKKWSKVKGIHTVITPICEALSEIVDNHQSTSLAIYYLDVDNHTPRTSAAEECYRNFLLTQVLKELIAKMNFDSTHLQQWIAYCRSNLATNGSDSQLLDILGKKYHHLSAIWCYAHDEFLSSTLNRSLRVFDVNILIKLSFFIRDLHDQIDRLHREQFIDPGLKQTFTVYHGQGLHKGPAEQMVKSKKGLVIFNSFLCASTDRRLTHDFAHRALKDADFVGLLFVMTIDPSKTTVPFAFINSVTGFEGKDEVLFPMHTVFRIRDIQSMGENNRLVQVGLTLSNDTYDNLYGPDGQILKETLTNIQMWDHLGHLLIKLEQFDRADEIYNVLFRMTMDEREKNAFHQQLGKIKDARKLYQQAMGLPQKGPGLHSDQQYHPNHSKIDEEAIAQGFQARTADTEFESIVSNPSNMEKWQKNLEMLKNKLFLMK